MMRMSGLLATAMLPLSRHGWTWSVGAGRHSSAGHPRVYKGKAESLQANLWMVVPSTTMTKLGGMCVYKYHSCSLGEIALANLASSAALASA
jgi:hypothetical protein